MASQQPDSAPKNKTATADETSKEIEILKDSKSEEKVLFWCDECGQKYRIPKTYSGKTGICFRCQAYLFIPSKSQEKPLSTKMIVFACAHCGSKQRKARRLIGTEAKCEECGEKNIVPKKSRTSSLSKDGKVPEQRILFWCKYCGQKYRLPKHLAGKAGSCDRCNNDFIIPDKSQDKPSLIKTIIFPCRHCGQKQWNAIEQTGKETECAKCGEKNIVPEKSQTSPVSAPAEKEEERIFFWCRHCGQKYRLPRSFAGKRANCDKCHNDFIVPMKSQVKPTRKETVIFPCEHCGKKIQKTRDLIGTEIKCIDCGKNNIVPEKSKKSLFDIITPQKSFEPAIAAEATRMNLKIPQKISKPADISTPQKPSEKKPSLSIDIPKKKKESDSKLKTPPTLVKKQTAEKDKDASLKIFSETEENILFWCSYCSQKYRLPHNLGGKRSHCDNCQNELLIPKASQKKPELKAAIVFSCKHCGQKLWKPEELAGKKITCHKCSKENTVPDKAKELEKAKKTAGGKTPIKLQDSLVVSEATVTNMIIVGKPPASPTAERKFNTRIKYDITPKEDETPAAEKSSTSLSREAYVGPQIIITEDPPTIQKVKNYFQRKAEKYFIFAVFVLITEYLINTYGEKRRPSKTFVIFSAFSVAAIILLLTWNYVTYTPPSKTSKCQYNVTCINPKCKLNEIRKFENVTKGTCSKCGSHVGLAYRCRNCKKSFVYDEVESRKQHKAKLIREANRKAKWTGKKVKIPRGLFNNRVIKKCPYCRSEDVYYVTVKQAEKEAEAAALEKELQKIDKKYAKKKTKKTSKKKKRRKKRK